MIINEKIIEDIYNLKKKISGKDKIKLSKYEEYIPMYDIYSKQIYPIFKKNIHYRLIDSHYRFITEEIKDWIQKQYNEDKNPLQKKNLEIIDNYDIKILIDTSYQVLYKYSKLLGLQISICKRKSFNPFIKHLKPYYTKNELIKLGENMGIIKNEIDLEKLNEKEYHYNICKKISSNDVSYEEIKTHTQEIIDNDLISWITYYSFTGAILFNYSLRVENNKNLNLNESIFLGLKKIILGMKHFKALEKDYIFYRFIWDDCFMSDLAIGNTFIDKGFTSTTRDPFYNPGLNGAFGLILLKIHVPKGIKGLGCFVENFSLFPSEEEFLIPPNATFKIISKDEHFKYYHTNPNFEKIIHKKYELELLKIDYDDLNKYKPVDNFAFVDFNDYIARGENKINILKNLLTNKDMIKIKIENKIYIFVCQWFDSTINSSYEKIYENKIKQGMLFSMFDENGYPTLNIELGNEMVVNFFNRMYFYKDNKQEINDELLNVIFYFGKIFHYPLVKIHHTFRNFSQFKNKNSGINIFMYNNFYNHTIYNYAKNKIKELSNDKYISNNFKWYILDIFLDKIVPENIKKKLNLKKETIRDNLIDLVENNQLIYDNFINLINNDLSLVTIMERKLDLYTDSFFYYIVKDRLLYELKDQPYFIPSIEYGSSINNTLYQLLEIQKLRRY
jgi:hypothetical protein